MVRMEEPAMTTKEEREAFEEFLAWALRGEMPPTETGLPPNTLYALEDLAVAAAKGEPTDELAAAARAAFDAEMSDR